MQKTHNIGGLYVISFSTEITKVGFSVEPKARVATQISKAWSLGVDTKESWFSDIYEKGKQAETLLINWCIENAFGRRNREYFSGLSFDDVVFQAQKALSV